MYTIAKRFAFSASHTIGGLPPQHPCARLHGHNYEVELILRSPVLDGVGFVRDFGELAIVRDFIAATLDHQHLNRWLYDWCKPRLPEVVAVRVSETPCTWAEYRP